MGIGIREGESGALRSPPRHEEADRGAGTVLWRGDPGGGVQPADGPAPPPAGRAANARADPPGAAAARAAC